MRLIRGLHNLKPEHQGCVATIGNFDGVHRGHQRILASLQAEAKQRSLPVTVITFEPQPREYLTPQQAPGRLTSFAEKYHCFAKLGIDQLVCLYFDQKLQQLSADQFIDQVLVKGLQVKHLVVGDDFRFGCDRSGDFKKLTEAGQYCGFVVKPTETVTTGDGERISSTRIRKLAFAGEFQQVERLLGRPFQICGKVIHGQKLGRQLGVPTANIKLNRLQLPCSGVFAIKAVIGEQRFNGVANLGIRPTINGRQPSLEVHLFDFQGNLYGQRMAVEFLQKIRDEKAFSGLSELQAAIQQDISIARNLLIAQL
ncbi:bifunctional riboflavin kinase/FAD synthetase [Spartinivicinus poritis]|uniref:Riboflavin biosynthesis protein n=1 Tax=Spartinivicinus poritis TaxID=2994640 RepID=A0ABT5U4S0_9GAMM|nr:bifunctional riboflavin kinase/FAD synthetase [Spartinivicinus sp. A2-2]MDE1460542.1 bifunctional riboflavin kinase/FAD synthetase [Spartinivicinus sp. A2-2]